MEDNVGLCNDFVDNMFVKLGWAPNTIWAELYLRVAKKLREQGGKLATVKDLVRKGLLASRSSEWKMMDWEDSNATEQRVMLPIAHEIQVPTSIELRLLAHRLGVEEPEKVSPVPTSQQQPLSTRLGLVRLCD